MVELKGVDAVSDVYDHSVLMKSLYDWISLKCCRFPVVAAVSRDIKSVDAPQ
jgi:hypothetical protein